MPLSYHTASVWPTGGCPWMLTVTLWSFLLICISYWYTVKEGIQDDKFQNYCLEPPIFNPFGRHQEAFSYLLTLDLPSSCTDPFWREGFLIVSHPLGVEMPEKPEDLPWRNHLSLSIWGGRGDSLPGLEDLLHPQLPVAERGHGSRKLGPPPCLSLAPPVLTLQLQSLWCPSQGAGGTCLWALVPGGACG